MENNEMPLYAAPGTKATVTLDGVEYEASADDYGTLRFKQNGVIAHLRDAGLLDVNAVARAFQSGAFSKRDYAEFNMMLGYSIAGFCDLSSFFDMPINVKLHD